MFVCVVFTLCVDDKIVHTGVSKSVGMMFVLRTCISTNIFCVRTSACHDGDSAGYALRVARGGSIAPSLTLGHQPCCDQTHRSVQRMRTWGAQIASRQQLETCQATSTSTLCHALTLVLSLRFWRQSCSGTTHHSAHRMLMWGAQLACRQQHRVCPTTSA